VVEAKILLSEEKFSGMCRPIAAPWIQNRRIVDRADGFAARPSEARQAPGPDKHCGGFPESLGGSGSPPISPSTMKRDRASRRIKCATIV